MAGASANARSLRTAAERLSHARVASYEPVVLLRCAPSSRRRGAPCVQAQRVVDSTLNSPRRHSRVGRPGLRAQSTDMQSTDTQTIHADLDGVCVSQEGSTPPVRTLTFAAARELSLALLSIVHALARASSPEQTELL